MSNYPTDILVDAQWLQAQLADPTLRVVDVRGGDPRMAWAYRTGHIPGALALNPGRDFFIFTGGAFAVAPPERIAQTLGQSGIANDSTIVIYDDTIDQLAAVTYWTFRYMGHRAVKVLNGGWRAWQNTGGSISREATRFAPTEYRALVDEATRVDAEWIQANLSRADVRLLDARSPNEYLMGHLPGAVNLPYDHNVDWRAGQFVDVATLGAQLQARGVTPENEIVVYCHSGMRSAHMFLALTAMGYPRVRNYDGSMADWHERRRLPLE